MQDSLQKAINTLVGYIYTYESDTFSSEASKITQEEAEKVLAYMVENWIPNDIDGVRIDAILEEEVRA